MNQLKYAIAMEEGLIRELDLRLAYGTSAIKAVLTDLHAYEDSLIRILKSAAEQEKLPSVISFPIETGASKTMHFVASNIDDRMDTYMVISFISSYTDKASQFYRQLAANNAYPYQKSFYNSLADLKLAIGRYLDSIKRSVYNDIWSITGFAPFSLAKD